MAEMLVRLELKPGKETGVDDARSERLPEAAHLNAGTTGEDLIEAIAVNAEGVPLVGASPSKPLQPRTSVHAFADPPAGRCLMPDNDLRLWPGRPFPLGASWDGRGVNFALFSARATKVELCLFGHDDKEPGSRTL
jgi:Carbohydrate-binding module 48 (Isoamylase N-terminal domain)